MSLVTWMCQLVLRGRQATALFFPRVRTPCGHGAQVIIEGREIQSDGGEKDKDNPTTNQSTGHSTIHFSVTWSGGPFHFFLELECDWGSSFGWSGSSVNLRDGHTEFSHGSSTVVHAKGGDFTDLVMMLIVISSFLGPTSALVEMNGSLPRLDVIMFRCDSCL